MLVPEDNIVSPEGHAAHRHREEPHIRSYGGKPAINPLILASSHIPTTTGSGNDRNYHIQPLSSVGLRVQKRSLTTTGLGAQPGGYIYTLPQWVGRGYFYS